MVLTCASRVFAQVPEGAGPAQIDDTGLTDEANQCTVTCIRACINNAVIYLQLLIALGIPMVPMLVLNLLDN